MSDTKVAKDNTVSNYDAANSEEELFYCSIYMTAESEDVAVHMATTLVKERLVACANVNTGMRSIYEWDGTIQLDAEVTVVMKTRIDRVDAIVTRVKEMHSYDVPCITATPIIGGNPDYLAWVEKQIS